MKVAHVVTYASTDGAFGGPVRVAFAQAEALAALGHEVTVYAGAPAGEASETRRDGFLLKTFPVRRVAPFGGFATLWPRGLARALRRDAQTYDVAHVHLARDLVTLPAALRFGAAQVPYVVQTHGMVDASDHRLARFLDVVATRRALRGASCWLVLTDTESADLLALAPPQRVARITNGVKIGEMPAYSGRGDVVLFLARLHERKRPLAFVAMATELRERLPEASFVMIGPDEGEGLAVSNAIKAAGLGERLVWNGSVAHEYTGDAFASARVYVLPAVNEVFPMSIIESLAAGTPVVTTDSLGIAEACEAHGAAIITDGTPLALADAVEAVFLNPAVAEDLRHGGESYLRDELDIRTVAQQLVREYERAGADRDH
jgi:glycosyltransferase involved in cell wall biosynthesis